MVSPKYSTLTSPRARNEDLPPLQKVDLASIKITSDPEEYSPERLENQIFLNKVKNSNFIPSLMTDSKRGMYIKMLKLQTPLK